MWTFEGVVLIYSAVNEIESGNDKAISFDIDHQPALSYAKEIFNKIFK